jgi:hypothetical protein
MHRQYVQIDQDLAISRFGGIEFFDLGGDCARVVVDACFVLAGDLD